MAKIHVATIPIHPPRPPRPARVPVLIVTHSDGFLEVFADKNIDVQVVTALDVSPDSEAIADDYLHMCLAKKFQRLHFADRRRAVGVIEHRTAEEEKERRCQVDTVRALRDFGRDAR